MYLTLVQNIALLIALSTINGLLMHHLGHRRIRLVLAGVLFGLVCVLGMMTPFRLDEGIIFDGRSVVLAVAGFIGGPVTGTIAAVIAAIYRYHLGGAGWLMGVAVITEATLIGILMHRWRQRRPAIVNPYSLYAMGLAVHAIMVLLMLLLPGGKAWPTFQAIALPVMLLYPPATLLVALLFLDQEARQRAADALKHRERSYRNIFNATGEAIFITDYEQGVHVDCNDAAVSLFHAESRDQILKHPMGWLSECSAQEDRDRLFSSLQKAIEGQEQTVEWLVVRQDGSSFWASMTARVAVIDNESRLITVIRDVTTRKQAEQALRESEARWRSYLEHAPDGVIVVDPFGVILEVNSAALRISGYNRDKLIGANVRMLLSDNAEEIVLSVERDLMTTDRVQFSQVIQRTDGQRVHVDISVSLLSDQAFVCFVKDVTEQKMLEAQLQQSHKMETIGRLAGGVAHDFNNMLTPIMGYAEQLLKDTGLPPKQRHAIEEIHRASLRARDMTRQLLTFARQQPVKPKRLNLYEETKHMMSILNHLVGEDIQVDVHCETAQCTVMMDSGHWTQILTNLCVNARQAIQQTGMIRIVIGQAACTPEHPLADLPHGPYVQVTVRDSDCGMDANTLQHLFDPFYTTKQPGEGTGLGLSVVYGIVRQAGGHITAECPPEGGSMFTIWLPLCTDSEEHRSEAPTTPQSATPSQPPAATVLLVEDEPAILKLAQTILSHHGYTVLTASSPIEALQLAAQHAYHIDLLVTDVVMPEMNGRQLFVTLQEKQPDLRCLFMSGYTADIIATRGELMPDTNFLQKPFTSSVLLQRIEQTLSNVS